MSIAGGIHKAFARAEEAGCRTLQIFSKNERQWQAKPLDAPSIIAFKAEATRSAISPLIVHGSYLINLGTPTDELWEKSIAAFADELERCEQLEIPFIVLHPGAHTGSGLDAGLQRVAEALNRLFDAGTGGTTTVLLETTAGQGTTLGGTFEDLARLLHLVRHRERVAVCVDTCHMYAAGYDISTAEGYHATIDQLITLVGIDTIKAFHLNDSRGKLGSHLDRHAPIGDGEIGLQGFRSLVNDERFFKTPMIIETPKGSDATDDIRNLTLLRSLRTTNNPPDANDKENTLRR